LSHLAAAILSASVRSGVFARVRSGRRMFGHDLLDHSKFVRFAQFLPKGPDNDRRGIFGVH
jgi:hypothetical protein